MHEIYILENKYEILEEKNGDCYIKDLEKNKYFFRKSYFASNKTNEIMQQKIKWNYKDIIFSTMLIAAFLSFIYIFYKYDIIYAYIKYESDMYIASILFLLISITLHELCHMTVLRVYGRKVGKVSFKLNFIFPALTVDTSDSYILPRYRRFFVYIAGIEMNYITCMLVLLLYPQYSYLLKPIVWAATVNLLPIGFIKTDGYHIIYNILMNKKDTKRNRNIFFLLGKYIFITITFYFISMSLLRSFGINL